MIPIRYEYLLLVISIVLSGCVSNSSMITPTRTETSLSSPTSEPPTPKPTSTLRPTETATLTPPATLKPEQAQEAIRTLLQESVDCAAPCFWGIMPEQTTLGEAINIFTRLGLNLAFTTAQGGKKFYGVIYDFRDRLRITPVLTIQDNIVKNFNINIIPEPQKAGIPREWAGFSPETLIERYGPPSKVDLFFDGGAPYPTYFMDMYFDSKKLIIEYSSSDLGPNLQVCPLIGQISSVRIWMGTDPENPPPDAVLLEKATSITMEEFIKLMTGDPNEACFNLNIEAFQ